MSTLFAIGDPEPNTVPGYYLQDYNVTSMAFNSTAPIQLSNIISQ